MVEEVVAGAEVLAEVSAVLGVTLVPDVQETAASRRAAASALERLGDAMTSTTVTIRRVGRLSRCGIPGRTCVVPTAL